MFPNGAIGFQNKGLARRPKWDTTFSPGEGETIAKSERATDAKKSFVAFSS